MASFASDKVKVYYWPAFGRAGAIIRMLEHVGQEYEHISDFPTIAGVASAFGGPGDTFAPPVLIDGDTTLGQSTAIVQYVGAKAGLDQGVDRFKAAQYLADIVDLFEGGINKNAGEGGAALKKYLEGDGSDGPSRFAKQATNLNRAVKGPFFFGDSPSYVDFFLCQHYEWNDATFLGRVEEETGKKFVKSYEKLIGAITGIQNLESYKNYSGPLKIYHSPDFCKPDEFFAEYKNAN